MSHGHDGHAHADHGHADHAHDPSHSPAHYTRIWMILMVLLFISVAGPTLEITVVTLLTAFGIAFVKAWLVIKNFMHLPEEPGFVHYILITSLVFMVLMFAAVSIDVRAHDGARWSNVAAKHWINEQLKLGDTTHHEAGGHEAAGGHEKAGGHEAAPAHDAAPAGH